MSIRYDELANRPDDSALSALTEEMENIKRGIAVVGRLASSLQPLTKKSSLEDTKHRIADIAGALASGECVAPAEDETTTES